MKNEETRLQVYELKSKNHHMEIRTLIMNRKDHIKQSIAMKTKDMLDDYVIETEWLSTDESINSNIELCSKTKSVLLKRKENISLMSHNRVLFLMNVLLILKKYTNQWFPNAPAFSSFPPKHRNQRSSWWPHWKAKNREYHRISNRYAAYQLYQSLRSGNSLDTQQF